MQFTNALFALAGLAMAAANTVEFINMDSNTRNIVFTAQEGLAAIDSIVIQGYEVTTVDFPESWIGNWYSYNDGADATTGMLGEVRWNGYAGSNYFDVSAIVDPTDNEGVKMLFPKLSMEPISGCETFPCSNAYNKPDDVATLSTSEETIVCLLGNLGGSQNARRASSRKSRSLIEA